MKQFRIEYSLAIVFNNTAIEHKTMVKHKPIKNTIISICLFDPKLYTLSVDATRLKVSKNLRESDEQQRPNHVHVCMSRDCSDGTVYPGIRESTVRYSTNCSLTPRCYHCDNPLG